MSQVSIEELAKKWGVQLQTAKNWERKGYNLDDEQSLARSLLTHRNLPRHVRAMAMEAIKIARDVSTSDLPEHASLEALRDYYWQMIREASDEHQRNFYHKQFLDTEKVHRDDLLAKKKLGLEDGETLQRDEVVRIFAAACAACVSIFDTACLSLSSEIVGETDTGKIYHKLRDKLFWPVLFAPLQQSAIREGPSSLPEWVSDTITEIQSKYVVND